MPGLPGCVKVRFIGCAAPGAVVVLGGAEKVRDPREPELPPPPTGRRPAEIAIDQRHRQRQGDGDRLDNSARASA